MGHVKDGLNAVGQAVRATAANRCRGWEWRTDLQIVLLSSRLAEVITYVESIDAESCKYPDIEPEESTRVAPAEQDIVEVRGGFDAYDGKGLTWLRKGTLQR